MHTMILVDLLLMAISCINDTLLLCHRHPIHHDSYLLQRFPTLCLHFKPKNYHSLPGHHICIWKYLIWNKE